MAETRTLPIGLVRASAAFALRQGWDVESLLAEAGVARGLLEDLRSRITEDQLVRLVQAIWRTTDDELFGLSTHPLPRGSFRLLCYGLVGAADLGEALDRLRGFLRAVPAIPLTIRTDASATSVSIGTDAVDDPEHLLTLVGLAAAHRVLSWTIRRELTLTRVELPFAAPEDVEGIRFAFAAPLQFEADRAALVFATRWLAQPLAREERDIDEFVRDSPRVLLKRPRYRTTYGEQVRRILEHGLKAGALPDAETVAARLAVSQQTLRRKLAEEDTSLRGLSEEVRRDAAVMSLVAGRETVAELASRLGFSEPSAFSRAFLRWTGSTPGAYRRARS